MGCGQTTRAVSSAIVLTAWWGFGFPTPALADGDGCHEAVRRAVALLPERPERTVILDINAVSPALRARLRNVEAFVTKGERTVYLNKQGPTLQKASKAGRRDRFFDYVLAIKIFHEMAHLEGSNEEQARREEEGLWREFVVSQKVDAARGLVYLDLLRRRHTAALEPTAPTADPSERCTGSGSESCPKQ